MRVAVVGAGIAGVGAAWALTRAGIAVDVFEARDEVGGNAKTHRWDAPGGSLVSGLAVLAWPEAYFHNYGRLLDELAISSEEVRLRYFVRCGDACFAHERGGRLFDRHARDFSRWRKMIDRLRAGNRRFAAGGAPSLYQVSYANPLTFLPAWPIARAHGISRAFWDDVVVAIYATSFLTTRLDALPATILPVLDDLISLESGGRMRSWRGHSGEVFDAMLRDLRGTVHRGRPIVEVRGDRDRVTLRAADGERWDYDQVVLAGDAGRMGAALAPAAHAGAKKLLARVRYVERRDETFADGIAHSDSTLLPAAHRETILRESCTFVDIVDTPAGRRYENHFVVSSWAPAARDRDVVMIASYGLARDAEVAGPTRAFSNRGGHPELSLANLFVGRRLRRWQGRDRVHYCGAYTTPGNGHDLSLLSGFVVAAALGAPHPFADDPAASRDFALLRRMMLGR